MNIDLLALLTNGSADKVIGSFDINTTSHSVAAATLSGGFYLPKTDTLQIANPAGRKALISMAFSIDGVNYYPQKYQLYQPGNPVPSGRIGATVGAAVSDDYITFYFTHYYGVQVDFTMKWVLDNIL